MNILGKVVCIGKDGVDRASRGFSRGTYKFGSALDCHIRVFYQGAAEHACSIDIQSKGQAFLKVNDLSGEVKVNDVVPSSGDSETERLVLHDGDIISVGHRLFRFEYHSRSEKRAVIPVRSRSTAVSRRGSSTAAGLNKSLSALQDSSHNESPGTSNKNVAKENGYPLAEGLPCRLRSSCLLDSNVNAVVEATATDTKSSPSSSQGVRRSGDSPLCISYVGSLAKSSTTKESTASSIKRNSVAENPTRVSTTTPKRLAVCSEPLAKLSSPSIMSTPLVSAIGTPSQKDALPTESCTTEFVDSVVSTGKRRKTASAGSPTWRSQSTTSVNQLNRTPCDVDTLPNQSSSLSGCVGDSGITQSPCSSRRKSVVTGTGLLRNILQRSVVRGLKHSTSPAAEQIISPLTGGNEKSARRRSSAVSARTLVDTPSTRKSTAFPTEKGYRKSSSRLSIKSSAPSWADVVRKFIPKNSPSAKRNLVTLEKRSGNIRRKLIKCDPTAMLPQNGAVMVVPATVIESPTVYHRMIKRCVMPSSTGHALSPRTVVIRKPQGIVSPSSRSSPINFVSRAIPTRRRSSQLSLQMKTDDLTPGSTDNFYSNDNSTLPADSESSISASPLSSDRLPSTVRKSCRLSSSPRAPDVSQLSPLSKTVPALHRSRYSENNSFSRKQRSFYTTRTSNAPPSSSGSSVTEVTDLSTKKVMDSTIQLSSSVWSVDQSAASWATSQLVGSFLQQNASSLSLNEERDNTPLPNDASYEAGSVLVVDQGSVRDGCSPVAQLAGDTESSVDGVLLNQSVKNRSDANNLRKSLHLSHAKARKTSVSIASPNLRGVRRLFHRSREPISPALDGISHLYSQPMVGSPNSDVTKASQAINPFSPLDLEYQNELNLSTDSKASLASSLRSRRLTLQQSSFLNATPPSLNVSDQGSRDLNQVRHHDTPVSSPPLRYPGSRLRSAVRRVIHTPNFSGLRQLWQEKKPTLSPDYDGLSNLYVELHQDATDRSRQKRRLRKGESAEPVAVETVVNEPSAKRLRGRAKKETPSAVTNVVCPDDGPTLPTTTLEAKQSIDIKTAAKNTRSCRKQAATVKPVDQNSSIEHSTQKTLSTTRQLRFNQNQPANAHTHKDESPAQPVQEISAPAKRGRRHEKTEEPEPAVPTLPKRVRKAPLSVVPESTDAVDEVSDRTRSRRQVGALTSESKVVPPSQVSEIVSTRRGPRKAMAQDNKCVALQAASAGGPQFQSEHNDVVNAPPSRVRGRRQNTVAAESEGGRHPTPNDGLSKQTRSKDKVETAPPDILQTKEISSKTEALNPGRPRRGAVFDNAALVGPVSDLKSVALQAGQISPLAPRNTSRGKRVQPVQTNKNSGVLTEQPLPASGTAALPRRGRQKAGVEQAEKDVAKSPEPVIVNRKRGTKKLQSEQLAGEDKENAVAGRMTRGKVAAIDTKEADHKLKSAALVISPTKLQRKRARVETEIANPVQGPSLRTRAATRK